MPTNYNESKLYRIKSLQTNQVFIGTTTHTLEQRMKKYKTQYKSYTNGKFHYCNSFVILEYGDAFIELIQDFPCNNKVELKAKEVEIIRLEENCVNKIIAGRTIAQYLIDKKDKIKEDKKAWHDANKDKDTIRRKQYYLDNKEQCKTYSVAYRLTNKEEIKRKSREYNEINKVKIAAKRASIVICICGAKHAYYETKKHPEYSKIHKEYLENLIQKKY